MDKIIACCGIECSSCDAYVATISNDDELRKKTSENWSNMFSADIQPKDINCLGCRSEVLFSHCNECEMRKCNIEKDLENCSKCGDYACERLEGFFQMVPGAKAALDGLRQGK